MNCGYILTLSVILTLYLRTSEAVTCSKITSCKCKMSDGSGDVDLTSLQGQHGQPRFKDVKGTESPDPLQYSYNPCTGFDEGGEYGCQKVAVCQVYSFTQVGAGTQDTAKFNVDGSGKLSVQYTQTYTTSTVDLICDKQATTPVFTAIGDPQSTNEIKLSLKHACACPGGCDDKGIVNPSGSTGGGGLSGGTILIIIVIVLLPMYLVGGIIYNVKMKQRSGSDVMPNADFWRALPGYIKDGFKFTFSFITNRGSYQQI